MTNELVNKSTANTSEEIAELRLLALKYVGTIFSSGFERIEAHQDLTTYLRKRFIEPQLPELQGKDRDIQHFVEHLITVRCSNDVFETLNYPTSDGRALIPLPIKYRKGIIDKFYEILLQIQTDIVDAYNKGDIDPLLDEGEKAFWWDK